MAQSKWHYKLVLLGEAGVGKSTLVVRFVKGKFVENQESTIGAAFLTQTVILNDVTVKFEIWDTAGQERYNSLAPMYYRNADAALVVYDITSPSSFDRAKSWVRELKSLEQKMVIALVGNKSDLQEQRQVRPQEAKAYAEDQGLLFLETSAKTAANVNELFFEIAEALPKKKDYEDEAEELRNLPLDRPAPQGGGGCCK